jgi:hypothetical protein
MINQIVIMILRVSAFLIRRDMDNASDDQRKHVIPASRLC